MTPLTEKQQQKIEAYTYADLNYDESAAIRAVKYVLTHLGEFLPEGDSVLTKQIKQYTCDWPQDAAMVYYEGALNSPYRALYEAMKQERDNSWIKYSERKPDIGQLVSIYRDIEAKQIYTKHWSEEDETWAEMNEITHWKPEQYPII